MHKGKHSSREGVPLPVLQQEEDLRREQPLPLVVFSLPGLSYPLSIIHRYKR